MKLKMKSLRRKQSSSSSLDDDSSECWTTISESLTADDEEVEGGHCSNIKNKKKMINNNSNDRSSSSTAAAAIALSNIQLYNTNNNNCSNNNNTTSRGGRLASFRRKESSSSTSTTTITDETSTASSSVVLGNNSSSNSNNSRNNNNNNNGNNGIWGLAAKQLQRVSSRTASSISSSSSTAITTTSTTNTTTTSEEKKNDLDDNNNADEDNNNNDRSIIATKTTTTRTTKKQQQQNFNRTIKLPMHPQPSKQQQQLCCSLSDSLSQWMISVEALGKSRELQSFVSNSVHVLKSVTGVAIQTACLPVTVPVRVTYQTTNLAMKGSVNVFNWTTALVQYVFHKSLSVVLLVGNDGNNNKRKRTTHVQIEELGPEDGGEGERELVQPTSAAASKKGVKKNENDDDDENVSEFVDQVWGAGSVVLDAVASTIGIAPENNSRAFKKLDDDNDTDDDYLDRLRLDYFVSTPPSFPDESSVSAHNGVASSRTEARIEPYTSCGDRSSVSKYLLRVDDTGLVLECILEGEGQSPRVDGGAGKTTTLCYVDLDSKSDPKLTERALTQIVASGLSLLSNHSTVRLSKPYPSTAIDSDKSPSIEWKTEGSTSKILKKIAQMTSTERLHALESDILIWSGYTKQSPSVIHTRYPFFLARGIVKRSPREFMELLWDNNRTNEYNNYCVGRTNLIGSDDDEILERGASQSTKVVESETRVPFTSMSVSVTCMMHVRPLEGPDEGYVIISRSCDTGMAGTHCNYNNIDSNDKKNEILWGINIFRKVPNHPHLTDLTSLSQVASSLVPKFLSSRIGLMGVEDFFRNVRGQGKTV